MKTKEILQMKKCENCGNIYPIAEVSNYENGSNMDYANTHVSYGEDPFQSEIYGDTTNHWLCDICVYNSYMEI